MANKTIWKYELNPADQQSVKMPKDAQILSLQVQNNAPCIWALVDPSADKEERIFNIYRTGHAFGSNPKDFIGTYQLHNGALVFHVFELLTPKQ